MNVNNPGTMATRAIVAMAAALLFIGQAHAEPGREPMKRFTNAERNAAARAVAERRAAAKLKKATPPASTGSVPRAAAGAISLLKMALAQLPNPTPNADYLGTVPNYAHSPYPVGSCSVTTTTACVRDADCPAPAEVCTNFTGGLRKFVDGLPGLGPTNVNNRGQFIPIAVPDTTTFPGSDYYELGLKDYTHQFHSQLPNASPVRGYYQINAPGGVQAPNYLGPTIVAQKDRPVRLKFTNNVATGAAGNLFVPVDTSIMGAGMGPLKADGTPCDPSAPGTTCAMYPQSRAVVHLHGGNTPWISDGTQHQWIVPVGEASPYKKGASQQNVPDMPAPGQGSATYYFTNQQSGRLMFYHDHSWGLTRLNVYAGEAAGYLLWDPVEASLVDSHVLPGADMVAAGKPEYRFGIPLIIQDKTFVPPSAATNPTLPVSATLEGQDPTWNAVVPAAGQQPGAMWLPHVYMPNQNPADDTGASAMGRWDYGPWFWPPMQGAAAPAHPADHIFGTGLAGEPGGNGCPVGQICEIPGTPNPSIVPEAFMDTALVNGVAYPTVTVDPKAYRFRILNAANDRFWNLSLYVADPSITSGPGVGAEVKLVDPVNAPVCPANVNNGYPPLTVDAAALANPPSCYPAKWPRDAAAGMGPVPDPRLAGPPFIQIGTEGGFLPAPVTIYPQPAAFNYNRRDIVVLNVTDRALHLGPAERADVVVDFSAYAGQTIILYNDSPAPVPAFDTRYDYFTGNADQTDTGGAPPTQPGFGPNTRTIMQIKVAATAPAAPFNTAALSAAFASTIDPNSGVVTPGAFAATQPAIIVPEAAYDTAYGRTAPATPVTPASTLVNNYARIQSTAITFAPYSPSTNTIGAPITVDLEPKAIHELFDVEWGRMNALLGMELPLTNWLTQTTIPYYNIDPPTEIFRDGAPSYWKITHNGVDTHAIHFHLVNVQVLNRVGWDGAIRPPDANELGWKDTVKMNPLEDIVVAMLPVKQTLPFPLPDSQRLLNPAMPEHASAAASGFTNLDPLTNNAFTPALTNEVTNFGQEYVWHCHLLGHEENDMMRPVVFLVNAEAPANLAGTPTAVPPRVALSWTDKSASETGFTVQRAVGAGAFATLATVPAKAGYGTTVTYNDSSVSVGGTYSYRVIANKLNTSVIYGTTLLDSAPSNVATATIAALPATPSGLTAAATGQSITLNWINNATNATSITVQRALNANFTVSLTTVVTLAPTATTFTNSGLAAATTYYYRVRASNAAGDSAFSNTASAATAAGVPAAPTGLRLSARTTTSITIAWTASPGATSYLVQRLIGGVFTQIGTATTTSFRDNGPLTTQTQYQYRVLAVNAAGQSQPSATFTVSTL